MVNFLKQIPFWLWLGIAVVIFIIWQSLSGWAMTSKLYNMALDNLRDDQSNVVKVLEENQAMYEKEIERISNELSHVKQQQASVRAENDRLKGVIHDLQINRESIVTPANVNDLVDGIRKLGLKSASIRKR